MYKKKDFKTTSRVAILYHENIGIRCFYGDVSPFTQWAMAWLRFSCIYELERKYSGRRDVSVVRAAIYLFFMFSTPLFLGITALCLLWELAKTLFWLFSCCHCCKSKSCTFRTRGSLTKTPQKKSEPPYPSKDDILHDNDLLYRDLVVGVQENVSCKVASSICFFGMDLCYLCRLCTWEHG